MENNEGWPGEPERCPVCSHLESVHTEQMCMHCAEVPVGSSAMDHCARYGDRPSIKVDVTANINERLLEIVTELAERVRGQDRVQNYFYDPLLILIIIWLLVLTFT